MSWLPIAVLLALAPPAEPSAFALLEQCRQAYRELPAYADSGEIEIATPNGGGARFRFETRYRPGHWSYFLEQLGDRSPDVVERPHAWAIWSDGSRTFRYDASSDAYHPVATAREGLIEMFGADRRGAALVALQLLAAEDLLESPLAASVLGTVDCGERHCWRVEVSTDGGAGELRLDLDAATSLVRDAEITIDPIDALAATGDVGSALREAQARARQGSGATRITVRYQPSADMARDAAVPFAPPSTATLAAPAAGAETGAAAGARPVDAPPQTEPEATDRAPGRVFAEEIEVRLSTVTVRAIDSSGRAIPDLGPADFRVRVGGEPVRIESVDWIAPSSERFTQDELAELARSGVTVPSTGRLIVIFVQTDLHPSRTPGHLRLLPEIKKLLATLGPEDEIAVVSFDSHLKLRQDFTRDVVLVEDAVERGIRVGREPEIAPGRFPSLARHLDFDAAKRAASPERALRLVGEALLPLPGEKVLIFAGWGLGNFFAGAVHMTPEYSDTREALARARVTVFVLDITRADYHSLEVGLETIAEDTGGTYEKTFQQPGVVTKRLARTLEGYYEIGFTLPAGGDGRGKVSVDLVGRRGEVLLRPTRIGG